MHVSDFLAAAVQLTSGQDPELNFNAAEEQIDLAARRGAELIGLPENFAFMGEDSRRLELAPTLAEQSSRFLVTMARRYQVALLGGGFPVPVGDGSRTLNRAELVDRDGMLLGRYDIGICLRWLRFPVSARWDCPFATTCVFLSSIAISSVPAQTC